MSVLTRTVRVSAVIAELVSNSYDADAEEVRITTPLGMYLATKAGGVVTDKGFTLSVKDNGVGMTPEEMQNFFLVVGRERRADPKRGNLSRKHKRAVMGRKGVGKLAPFGICKKIEVISSGGELTTAQDAAGNTTSGYLTSHIILDYSRNLRDEVKKGLYGRLKQGLYPFRAPLGYLDQGGGKMKTIDPIRGPLVRRAFELYASRRYSLDTLRAELQRQGLRARRGKPLSRESLSAILNNPFYVGLMRVARTGETFAGMHEALVTRALFDRVQAILRDRTNIKVVMHEFTFRRLIRCAACSYVLTAERQKGHVYYRCHQRSCPGVSIREDDILSELRWFSEIIRFEEEDLREMRDFVEADIEDAAESRALEEARIKRAIGLCDERLERLTDAVIDGLIDKEAFEVRKRSLLSERQDLMDLLKSPPEDTPAEERLKKFELANMAYLGLVSATSYEIREAVEKTTSNLSLEGKNLVFKPRFPFDEIAKSRIFMKCGL